MRHQGSEPEHRLDRAPGRRRPELPGHVEGRAVPPAGRIHPGALVAAVLLIAFALRLVLAIHFPTIERPDETYQTLEPAYRLWRGWGVVTWEWREGVRSWLLPGALFAVMSAAGGLGLSTKAALLAIAGLLSLLSLGVVAGAMALGRRQAGAAGALAAGIAAALWPDLVYFAPKTLSEVQAGHLLVIAAILAELDGAGSDRRRRSWRPAAIGGLLGFALALRFQFAPAVLFVAVWTGRLRARAWLAMAVAGLVPVVLLGVIDIATLGRPFASILDNYTANILEGRADSYGMMPPGFFAEAYAGLWGWTALPIGLLALIGTVRVPLLAAMAAAVVLSHSLIAHKEISFVFPAVVAVVVLAGIGAAVLVGLVERRLGGARPAWLAAGLGCALCAWGSVSVLANGYRDLLSSNAAFLAAAADLNGRADLCGLGYFGPAFPWYQTGGYTHLDRAVPIYLATEAEAEPRMALAANYLLVLRDRTPAVQGFEEAASWGNLALLRREGACRSDPALEINRVLMRSRQ